MKRSEHEKNARKFAGERQCYLHCEVSADVTQCCVTGDPKAIIYGCFRILQRTSELSGMPFDLMVRAIQDLKDFDKAEREELD